MSQTLQIILGVVALIGAVSGFLIWHFKEMHKLRDQIQALKLEMKDLEKRDDLQQQTIDQLKELFPILKDAVEHIKNQKQLKK
jgi:proteasome assembly chaperone (PAC2) family protein